MSKENESAFRRWVEDVWNKGKENTIEELFDEKGVAEYQYYKGDKPILGINRYKGFVRMLRGMFTDFRVTIEQISADDSRVLAVCVVTAKRRRDELDGFKSQKTVKAVGLCQMIFENGKIIKTWNNIDLLTAADLTENFVSKTV